MLLPPFISMNLFFACKKREKFCRKIQQQERAMVSMLQWFINKVGCLVTGAPRFMTQFMAFSLKIYKKGKL